MKTITTRFILIWWFGASLAGAQSPEDPKASANLVARISIGEAQATWCMSDGFVFREVKVTKTVGGWAEIEYSVITPRTTKTERTRCWVNTTQLTRIYSGKDANKSPKEAEQGSSGQPPTRSESKSEGGDKPQPEAEGRPR